MKIEMTIPVERFSELHKEVKRISKKFKVTGMLRKNSDPVIVKKTNSTGEEVDVICYNCEIDIEDAEMTKFEGTGANLLGTITKGEVVTVSATKIGQEKGVCISSLKEEIEKMSCSECGRDTDVRKKVFVFEDNEGLKTYGTTCAKKHFGVDFERIIKRFSRIKEEFFGFGSGCYEVPEDGMLFLTVALYLIKNSGYVSGSKAYNEGGNSTRNSTWNVIHSAFSPFDPDKDTNRKVVDAAIASFPGYDFSEIKESFTFKNDESDFEFNMNQTFDLLEKGYVISATSGYLAFIAFLLHKKESDKKDDFTWNEDHDYKVGDKLKNLKVAIVSKRGFNTDWGYSELITFRTEDNVKLKWFSKPIDADSGEIVTIKSGSVKKIEDHPTYGKSVVVTRCRIEYSDDLALEGIQEYFNN